MSTYIEDGEYVIDEAEYRAELLARLDESERQTRTLRTALGVVLLGVCVYAWRAEIGAVLLRMGHDADV